MPGAEAGVAAPALAFDPNPFAAPLAEGHPVLDAAAGSDAQIRREHLKAEANIRAIGMLQMVGGGLGAVGMTLVTLFGVLGDLGMMTAIFAPFIALYAGLFYVGMELRNLRSWARWVVVSLSVPGLLGFPVGTLISVYFIVTLTNAKAKVVLTDGYRQIRERTPHIQYRTSPIIWVMVGVLVVALLALGALVAG